MKTKPWLSAGLALALLATRTLADPDVRAGWNTELAAAQQSSHQSVGGRARADVILRQVMGSATTGLAASKQSGRAAEVPPAGANRDAAVAQAAYEVMSVLYPGEMPALDARLAGSLAAIDDTPPARASGQEWGRHVAAVVLAEQGDAVAINPYSFVRNEQPPVSLAPSSEVNDLIPPGRYEFATLAGQPGTRGHVDGTGSAARLDNPGGIAVDAAGNVYVSEPGLCTIRKIAPGGVVTTLAGTAGEKGSQDGAGPAARFNKPSGLATDGAGNVYVADTENYTIRKITPDGVVTTLAGIAGKQGLVDGAKSSALFGPIAFVATDDAGNAFVSESGKIRKITPDGTVSTLPTEIPPYVYGYANSNNGTGPLQLRFDHAGNLYIIFSDQFDFSEVVKLTPNAAGKYVGRVLPPPSGSGWAYCLAVDDADNVYVKYDYDPICLYTPDGRIAPRHVSGASGGLSWTDMAVDRSGRLIVLPAYSYYTEKVGTLDIGTFDSGLSGQVFREQPIDEVAVRGYSAGFNVWAAGTPPYSYQWYFNSSPLAGATRANLSLSNVQDGQAGYYSVMVTDATGSMASRQAMLTIIDPPPPPPPVPVTPTPLTGSIPTTAPSAGAGGFENWFSLPVFMLLVAAALRRPRGPGALALGGLGAARPLTPGRVTLVFANDREDVAHG